MLKFKKSLFAGVLDGGEREVFLGGSRLTRFMETVEKTTAAITEPAVVQKDEPTVAGGRATNNPPPEASWRGPDAGHCRARPIRGPGCSRRV